MAKPVNRSSSKKSPMGNVPSTGVPKVRPKAPKTSRKGTGTGWCNHQVVLLAIIIAVVVACVLYITYRPGRNTSQKGNEKAEKTRGENGKVKTSQPNDKSSSKPQKSKSKYKKANDKKLPPELQDFKMSVQKELRMNQINIDGKPIKIQELKHNDPKSSVKAYLVEHFLGDYECENLMRVHKKYLDVLTKNDPIMCFDSVETLSKNLKELRLKYKVSEKDFTEGTTCLNESFSSQLKPHFKWSYSMAFYPGENKFSTMYAKRIQDATGLMVENGGKFQITSYPVGVGYKSHTDCIVWDNEREDKRDRYATILVYLQDVEEGGETEFPLLGIKVKPKKGLALIWNSMDANGKCDPLSLHDAKKVYKGYKYIIQRWYYYQNFPALGKRPPVPSLPARKKDQPRVSCDMYEQGSCRWYDEWNYDHITEYSENVINNLV